MEGTKEHQYEWTGFTKNFIAQLRSTLEYCKLSRQTFLLYFYLYQFLGYNTMYS